MSTVVPLFGTPRNALPGTRVGRVKPSGMTVVSGYLVWLAQQGLSSCTIEQRVKFARLLLAQWGTFDRPAHEVVSWLMSYRGWTRRTYYNHLTSIYTYLIEIGEIAISPLARMTPPKEPRPNPNPLSPEELRRVLAAADERMLAWLLLGSLAGLRAHEIAQVHGRDISEQTLFVHGKGDQDALLPVHPLLWKLAQRYPRDDWWFPSPQRNRDHVSMALVSNSIRYHFRACGVEGRGAAHRLRYSYGTNLARQGANMRVVQELLRHKQLATTERYILVEDSERRAAVMSLSAVLAEPTAVA